MARNLSTTVVIGGAVAGTFRSAIGAARQGLGDVGSALQALTARQRELNDTLKKQERLGRDANLATVGAASAELRQIESQIRLLRQKNSLIERSRALMDRGRSMIGSGVKMVGAVGVAGATLGIPVREAAEQQTAALGIAKQFEGTRDMAGQLTQSYHDMIGQVRELARVTPIATTDLLRMTGAAGQMGIKKDDAVEFVKSTAMMVAAFDLPADQLAEDAGKIAGVYNIPIAKIGGLADSINYLSDNTLAKGGEVIDVLKRIGGVAASVKLNEKDAAALGATMISLGSTSETASTAINAALSKLASAGTSSKMTKALKTMGLDAKRVQAGMITDARGTLLSVMEAVQKLPEVERIPIMTMLFGAEHADDLSKLSARVDMLRANIEMAHSKAAQGSMQREYDAGNQTAEKQYQMLRNTLSELSATIGEMVLPALGRLMGMMGSAVGSVTGFVRENRALVMGLGSAAITFGTVVGALGSLKLAVGGAMLAFGALKWAMAATPIGITVAALSAAAAAIYANWEPIKWFFSELWEGVSAGARAAVQWIGGAWDGLRTAISDGIEWIMGKLQPVINTYREVVDWTSNKVGAVQGAHQGAVDWASGKMESVVGWFTGRERVRADAPVPPRALPSVAARSASTSNTVTINVKQLPGENAEALARRIADIQRREAAVRARGSMIDGLQPAF